MNKLNRFNWIARSYDRLVKFVFGETLHHAQMYFMNAVGETDSVLILGGGSGKFLDAFIKLKPFAYVTYVEASSEMLTLAKSKVGENSKVTFIHGTQENIAGAFDVLITNFFLDLFPQPQLESLTETVSKNLAQHGKWFIADFENTPRFSHRVLLFVMYRFFWLTGSIDTKRLPEWRSVLRAAGFRCKAEASFCDGFVKANVFSRADQ